jgi:hypothetical protein
VLELLLAIQRGVKRVTTFTPRWNFFSDPTRRKKGHPFYAVLELLLASFSDPTQHKKGDPFYAVLELFLASFSDLTQRKKGHPFYAALELLLANFLANLWMVTHNYS